MEPGTVITKRFLICPSCKTGEFSIDHIKAGYGFGPWSCNRSECDAQVSGMIGPDMAVSVTVTRRDEPRGFALLQLGNLLLVLKEDYGRVRNWDFFYHSHQCPSNLMKQVYKVYDADGQVDPHGRLRYIAGIDDTLDNRDALDAVCDLKSLLDLFQTTGIPTKTEWSEENEGMIPFVAQSRKATKKKKVKA